MRRYHLKRLTFVASELRSIIKANGKKLTFLDVGCGDGTYESLLERDFSHLIGIDVILNNLKTAKKNVKNKGKTDFILADAKHLPLKDFSIDVVLCSEVLEHLHDPMKAFSELLHVFRKTLLLTVPLESVNRKLAKILQYNRTLCKIETEIGHVSMHKSLWWTTMIHREVEAQQIKCHMKISYFYVSAEPFTSIFARLKNGIILRVLNSALGVLEKALSSNVFANNLMISLKIE
jgi:ubiquinone/menaquinone biosynthesis C-methylase UbiE